MLSIVTVDFDKGLGLAHTDALMADAQVVYGSQSSIYVATQKWIDPSTPAIKLPAATTTQIVAMSIAEGVKVKALTVQSTTLDDVFVHYTGRQLRDATQQAFAYQRPVQW